MITEKELNLLNLSATKKDFYQIWNEILEVSSKLSERWDPQSTNETDPGIVLLKVLTAVADKLNYNIDKNILEAFMPTAAQDESMRKLCDMMGYSIKYYRSATTNVTVSYTANTNKAETALPDTGLVIPMFSVITNIDKDLSYITTAQAILLNGQPTVEIPCIEGQIVQCESDTDNIITMAHLDEENRYYLPETQVAENGIFIYNITDNIRSDAWKQVDNLNTQPTKSRVYKFGFDSREYRPYIQFPDDISNLIEDGIELYYVRTSGIMGNMSARTLAVLEKPTTDEWNDFAESEYFTATNYSTVTNGRNPETIKQAYNAFKKTIGTFDTLVTCRDYMNKIYSLALNQNTYLVSNIVVSDIRDDINRAQTLCSFNDFGLCYLTKPCKETSISENTVSDAITPFNLILYPFKTYNNLGTITDYKNSFTYTPENFNLIENMLKDSKTISHQFDVPRNGDIVCIKNYLRLNAKITTATKVSSIEEALIIKNIKTALYTAFNMRELDFGQEIPFDSILECIENADTLIKNVSLEEPVLYTRFVVKDGFQLYEYDCASSTPEAKSCYNRLALRNILAGRIKLFNYDTSFGYDFTETSYGNLNIEYNETSSVPDDASEETMEAIEKEIEDSNEALKSRKGLKPDETNPDTYSYYPQYPVKIESSSDNTLSESLIRKLQSELALDLKTLEDEPIVLNKHEVIKFRAPNFVSASCYPAYVNYFLKLGGESQGSSIPATFQTLLDFLNSEVTQSSGNINLIPERTEPYIVDKLTYWDLFMDYICDKASGQFRDLVDSVDNKEIKEDKYYAAFAPVKEGSKWYTRVTWQGDKYEESEGVAPSKIFYIKFTEKIFGTLTRFIQSLNGEDGQTKLLGLFRKIASAGSYQPGYMVDVASIKYGECSVWRTFTRPLDGGSTGDCFYVQKTWDREINENTVDGSTGAEIAYKDNPDSWHTTNGLGRDISTRGIPANTEYQLQNGEYLLINYLPSSTSEDTGAIADTVNEVYGPGAIIRPNFQLLDSEFKHTIQGKTYAKTSGFDFSHSGKPNPPGMFSLGPTEQIEPRDLVQVTLQNKTVNLYWVLNGTSNSIPNEDDGIIKDKENGITKYTLKAGEFLYYTDERKTDLAYYGEGTEIVLYGDVVLTGIDQKLTEAETEDLGLENIPWKTYGLTENSYIVLKEYQYITLTEGDSLISLSVDGTTLSNDWKTVQSTASSPVRYSIGDTVYALPGLSVEDMSWEVRSLLEFETGPNTSQTLYRTESSVTAYTKNDNSGEYKELVTIRPTYYYNKGKKIPKEISFRTNIDIAASTDTIYLLTKKELEDKLNSSNSDETEALTSDLINTAYKDLLIKVFASEDIKVRTSGTSATGSTLPADTALILHNVEGKYTKLSMANLVPPEAGVIRSLTLPITIDDDKDFALIMFYYIPGNEETSVTNNAGFKVINGVAPKIYNYPADSSAKTLDEYIGKWHWWADLTSGVGSETIYHFKSGLNIVYFDKSTTISLIPDTKTVKTTEQAGDTETPDETKEAVGASVLIFADPTPIYAANGGLDIVTIDYNAFEQTSTDDTEKCCDNENCSNCNSDETEIDNPTVKAKALQLLKDLAQADYDNKFYYNCPIENDIALDLSYTGLSSDDKEKLSSPRLWYDTNNINNKFVISEIDADYLSKGLQIAKSSKR